MKTLNKIYFAVLYAGLVYVGGKCFYYGFYFLGIYFVVMFVLVILIQRSFKDVT